MSDRSLLRITPATYGPWRFFPGVCTSLSVYRPQCPSAYHVQPASLVPAQSWPPRPSVRDRAGALGTKDNCRRCNIVSQADLMQRPKVEVLNTTSNEGEPAEL